MTEYISYLDEETLLAANAGAGVVTGDEALRLTARQFTRAMRASGWERVGPAGNKTFAHGETGVRFEGEQYTPERGVLWQWYATRGVLPSPLK